MFKSVYNRGFQMTFENGVTISVQWGTGNYCERRSMTTDIRQDCKSATVESNTAEVALWDRDGKWITRRAMLETFGKDIDDDVEGWLNAEEVGNLMLWAQEA